MQPLCVSIYLCAYIYEDNVYMYIYIKHIDHWNKIPFPVIFQGSAATEWLSGFTVARLQDSKFELR